MTKEQVKQGVELLKKLSWLKDQKNRWEKACRFYRLEVVDCKRSYSNIDGSFVNFEELKLLTIAGIDARIKEIQKEFDEL
jgi:hypothetical protein